MSVNRWFWYGAALALAVLAGLALWLAPAPATALTAPLLVLVAWAVTWLGVRAAARGATGERVRGAGLAFVLLGALALLHVIGLLLFQPMRSNPPGLGYVFNIAWALWLLTFAVGFNTDDNRLRSFGRKVARSRFSGLLVFCGFVFVVLASAEYALRFFAIQSFGASSSILTANYLGVVWGEPNTLGFRDDREPTPPENPETQAILLVGDSLAAGFGVDDRADRVGDILDARLGDDAALYLVARPGWETQTQFENLQAYPVPPDMVIVSYFVNDVTEAYNDAYEPVPPHDVENPLVNRLFVPSFLYWNVFLRLDPADDPVARAQDDPAVLAAHADEIREVVRWVRGQDATVAYLVWPHPVVMDGNAPLLDTVFGVLDELDVPYVDMGPLMKPYPVVERVATAYDPHPSAEMHRVAAEALWDVLNELGLLSEIHEETSERGTRLVRYPTPQQAQRQATYAAVDIKQVWFNRHVGTTANPPRMQDIDPATQKQRKADVADASDPFARTGWLCWAATNGGGTLFRHGSRRQPSVRGRAWGRVRRDSASPARQLVRGGTGRRESGEGVRWELEGDG